MAASVANQAAAAGVAVGTVVLCFVQFTGLYRYSDMVSQVEVLGLADEIKTSLEGIVRLVFVCCQGGNDARLLQSWSLFQ